MSIPASQARANGTDLFSKNKSVPFFTGLFNY